MTPIYVRTMAAYGSWMNGRMLDLCGGLSDAERKRDLGAFFKSVHGTFDHLIYGDVAWMGRFTGSPMPTNGIGDIVYESWSELDAARRAMDNRIGAWAAQVTEEWLSETMSFISVSDGKTRILPRWVLVTHMFNHGTHHRGQLTALMKQLGIDPGVTDLPWLPALYDGRVLSATQL
ncbi:DinB family protein [Dongia deserti]|uniref:DinB family protein n=1 Tax=Dongia deserti TaxID=2268030 RepID=UPI000E65D436|nr:DinB family protein [Dongia deserti]